MPMRYPETALAILKTVVIITEYRSKVTSTGAVIVVWIGMHIATLIYQK